MSQSKIKLQKKIYTVFVLGVLVMVLTLIFGIIMSKRFTEVHDIWYQYAKQEIEISQSLAELNRNIGYGGFIHNFKNLILRRDLNRYQKAIELNFIVIRQQIDNIKALTSLEEELIALEQIRLTFNEYAEKYKIAKIMVIEQKSSAEIDAIIKVSDTNALAAMNVLSSSISKRTREVEKSILKKESDALFTFQFGGTIALLIIFTVVFVFIYYLKQLIKINLKLQEQKEIAEDANLVKSQFLSSMSHELRTPLNAILGFSQLLELDEKDDEKRKDIQQIIAGGNHLLELINQVLDLSKIESGNVEFSIDTHSLHEILNYCLIMIKPIADKHAIQIDDKVSSLSDINISVDEIRFKQVLLNILSNAIKYNSDKGKVTIDCSSNENNMLKLSITDTGKGFTAEQLSKLFEAFERFGAANSHIEGTGLGLVIAKDLIELMGGTINVESEIGKGSQFIIQVPLS